MSKNLVCEKCGGKNLEVKVWADYYTDKVLDDTGDTDDSTRWCRDCQEHIDFITEDEFKLNRKEYE